MLKTNDAARLLGCKPSEIESIADSPAGVVITTTDNVAMIDVPVDHPDGEGKTGLMLLAAPSETPVAVVDGRTLWNSTPLYVAHPDELDSDNGDEDAPADVTPAGGDAAPPQAKKGKVSAAQLAEITEDLEGRSKPDLVELAKARQLDLPSRATKPQLIEALAPILALEENAGA
jgi:hypothetical protein